MATTTGVCRYLFLPALSLLLSGVFLSSAQAQVPNVLSYDGYLTNPNGSPVNGRKDLTFALYTAPTDGTPVWQEVHENVLVSSGTFRVVLGRGTVPQPMNIPFDHQYYLGVRVGKDPEMTPRQELMPSAYSFRARTADSVPDTSLTGDKLKPLSVTDEKIQSVSWSKITGFDEGLPAKIWSLQGNRNSDPNTDFLGTVDEQNLIFRTNSLPRMVLHSGGDVDINSHLLTIGSITSRTSATEGAFYLGDNNFGLRRMDGVDVKLFSNGGNLFLAGNNLLLTGGNVGVGTLSPTEKLHVAGNALFTGNLTGSGNGSFDGTLRVKGLATLNDATVLGDLNATGNFVVSGTGEFANLRVTNDGLIGSDTAPGRFGIGRIYSDVNLNVLSNTGADHPFNIQVGADTRFRVHNDGRLLIGTNPAAGIFAVDIRAKKHGMVLSMDTDGGELNSSTKFVSFQVGSTVRGRIEGQSATEIDRDPLNIFEAASNGAQLGIAIGMAWVDPGNLAQEIAEKAVYVARLVAAFRNAGVSYVSGNGDYAEWLPRVNEKEEIEAGDVVGVFGGRISRLTKGAERLMAVSSNPIVLGNMPEKSKEHLCEKVAFLGQVPVKVIGVVEEGDYIVSTGRDDGWAVAISPKLMTSDEFPKVVGRAWESSKVPYGKLINVAVGLTGGDMVPIVKRLENNLRDLRTRQEAGANTLAHTQKRLEELESKIVEMNLRHDEMAELKAAVRTLQHTVRTSESFPRAGSTALSATVEN